MSIRFILQCSRRPSHALTVCEPWTRWLVETESPSGRGHAIADKVALHKATNSDGIITAIEVEQLQQSPAGAQRYLEASGWWLHRAPFGVERLPVKIIAHKFEGLLIHIDGWTVIGLDVGRKRERTPPHHTISLAALAPLLSHLKHLDISHQPTVDVHALQSVDSLETVTAVGCEALSDLSLLRRCVRLTELNVSYTQLTQLSPLASTQALPSAQGNALLRRLSIAGTRVSDLRPLASLPHLQSLDVTQCRALTSLDGLQHCHALEVLDLVCSCITDLAPLSHLPSLRKVDASFTHVESLATLRSCPNLSEIVVTYCNQLVDLSELRGAPSLRLIDARRSAVSTLASLNTCRNLRKVVFDACEALVDLSPLADAPLLEEIVASGSGVTTLTGLNRCPSLKMTGFRYCSRLLDITELSGAPALETIDAGWTGIAAVEGLHRCPRLKKVYVMGCDALHDLTPLAEAPSLQVVYASENAWDNARGLETRLDRVPLQPPARQQPHQPQARVCGCVGM